tara:strand:+ start:229 stop:510 length:282 start_codon:yes stop_codon:yes gene_type:complete
MNEDIMRYKLLESRNIGETVYTWCRSIALSETITPKQANTAICLLELDKQEQRNVIIIDDTMHLGKHNVTNYRWTGIEWIATKSSYNKGKRHK